MDFFLGVQLHYAINRKKLYYHLSCVETKERSAYRYSTLYAEQLLKLNMRKREKQSVKGLLFSFVP